jgi:hypothetical protein
MSGTEPVLAPTGVDREAAARRNRRIIHPVGTVAVLAAVATVGISAGPAGAVGSATTLECESIACAAAYIGVPAPALAAEIVTETWRTGTLGLHVAIEELDAAMVRQLSAGAPMFDSGLVPSYRAVIARHDTIRDALLDQTVTALRSVLGVVSPP